MDNQLKERLVGATVLVVLAVIFIPMLLDGPDSRQRIQQKVDLPPAGGQQTVRIDLRESGAQPEVENSEKPAPAASEELAEVDLTQAGAPATIREDGGSRAGEPESSAETGTAEAAEENGGTAENDGTSENDGTGEDSGEAKTANVVTPEPARPEGAWTVQVGSFGNSANADALAERLSKLGYEAFVSRYDDGSRIHFRVRVGGYATRDAAAAKAEDVKRRTGEPARPAKND